MHQLIKCFVCFGINPFLKRNFPNIRINTHHVLINGYIVYIFYKQHVIFYVYHSPDKTILATTCYMVYCLI